MSDAARDDTTTNDTDDPAAGRVPVGQWIPHPQSDYVDWMDRNPRYFSDMTPDEQQKFLAGLSPERRAEYETTDTTAPEGEAAPE